MPPGVSLATAVCAACAAFAAHHPHGRQLPVVQLVPRARELPGFVRGEYKLRSGASLLKWLKSLPSETAAEARKGAARLRREGFREGAQATFASEGGGGVAASIVFATPVGARAELATATAEERAQSEREHVPPPTVFRAPAVAGSEGFTASQQEGERRYADLYFVLGRCFISVSDAWYGPSSEFEVVEAPIAGATAVYRRAARICATGHRRTPVPVACPPGVPSAGRREPRSWGSSVASIASASPRGATRFTRPRASRARDDLPMPACSRLGRRSPRSCRGSSRPARSHRGSRCSSASC